MALPTTREEFKLNCLRRLGYPVTDVNLDDDQIDDRIDEALSYYWDYHFDGSEVVYYKHLVTSNNFPSSINNLTLVSGGTNYSNSDTISIPGSSNAATASLITNGNGTITSVTLLTNGKEYRTAPTVTINTSTGSGASITAELGGFISLPENIIGAVRLFDLGSALQTNNMFNIRYQIALNDLYTLTSVSMLPYVMALTHVQQLEQLLVGRQPIRYNRHKNRLYLDMNWDRFTESHYIVVEAYQVVDPNTYTDVWKDRWLLRYAACLIKQQYGTNLSKHIGAMMTGPIKLNGDKIYNDATTERVQLEQEMIYSYSLPATDMVGVFAPFILNTSIGLATIIGVLNEIWNRIPMV